MPPSLPLVGGIGWLIFGWAGGGPPFLLPEPAEAPLAIYQPYLEGEKPLRVALAQGLTEVVIQGLGAMEGWRKESEPFFPSILPVVARKFAVISRPREVPSEEAVYRLVIGQYADRTEAEKQAANIRKRGLKAYVRSEGDTLLVQVDGLHKQDWVNTLQRRVASAGYPDCRVEPYTPLRCVPGLAVTVDENELPVTDLQGVQVTPAAGTLLTVETPSWSARPYRGAVSVQLGTDGRLTLINEVSLEDYLQGVLPLEMGPGFAPEALKAQAVAARTYALICLLRGAEGKQGYHFAVQNTQAYGGVRAETSLTDDCVAATRGEVLTFQDHLVQAVFHTVCGGYTEDVSNVWGLPAPCLRGGPDGPFPAENLASPEGIGRFLEAVRDSYCRDSPVYRWTASFSRTQLQNLLARTLPRMLGQKEVALRPLVDLRVEERSRNGRVQSLAVVGRNHTYLVHRDAIRWLFGTGSPSPTGLKSTLFVIRRSADGSRYTFFGGGWGHGAGLCQQGAQGLARAGHTYQEILLHYYPGAALMKIP